MSTRKKILLVDDELAILRVLRIKLRISGYDVFTAANSAEAFELIDSASPDIMMLDIIMPGMNGFEVLRRLRLKSRLPVIVFSAKLENAKRALSLGANDFLGKPFDVDEMVKRIELVLDSPN
jgi:DNA-binding response OmpR family regulator